MDLMKGVLAASVLLIPAAAQGSLRTNAPELAVGILAHGIRWGLPKLPENQFYEGTEERDTADVQIAYRSKPISGMLRPRLTAKVQVNTGGRTSFASIGAEWRQHILGGRVYGQTGIGLTVHNGYLHVLDPFDVAPGSAEFTRRYDIYSRRTGFGSPVLLNPNLSAGVRINRRWAIEATYEHFSHKQLFAKQNPGIDTIGLRLIKTLGKD